MSGSTMTSPFYLGSQVGSRGPVNPMGVPGPFFGTPPPPNQVCPDMGIWTDMVVFMLVSIGGKKEERCGFPVGFPEQKP